MARIYPFRALRYNPSLVRMEDVVTQPYDKISPAMQQAYYQRSLYNLVRIILGLPELFDEPGSNDVYTRAARDFADAESALVMRCESRSTRLETNLKSRKVWTMPCPSFMPCVAL